MRVYMASACPGSGRALTSSMHVCGEFLPARWTCIPCCDGVSLPQQRGLPAFHYRTAFRVIPAYPQQAAPPGLMQACTPGSGQPPTRHPGRCC